MSKHKLLIQEVRERLDVVGLNISSVKGRMAKSIMFGETINAKWARDNNISIARVYQVKKEVVHLLNRYNYLDITLHPKAHKLLKLVKQQKYKVASKITHQE